MKTFDSKRLVRRTILCLALGAAVYAQAAVADGCSNATLQGEYALRVSGQVFGAGKTVVQRDGIDMVTYDGAGHFTQVDFVFADGVLVPGPTGPTGFHIHESGTYTVNADCTGKATLKFASPEPGVAGAVIEVMFVLGNHGRTVHQIVSSLMPPGPVGEQVAVPANIHADGEKQQGDE